MEARAGVDAVIFDYGGVVRREDAAEFDEFAARHGLHKSRGGSSAFCARIVGAACQ